MNGKARGVTAVEFILSCVIIFILIGIASVYFTKTLTGFREVALRSQLGDIRMSVKVYRIFHNRLPGDIRTLLTEKVDLMPYSGAVIKKKHVESLRSDKEGFPVDPFGNRYAYSPVTGEVRPTTKGYEDW